MTVGMLQVKHKCKRLKELKKRPIELVQFILLHPIRVVLGPKGKAYVIDHHHLALALTKAKFETAPMLIEDDFSRLSPTAFWKKMIARQFVHPVDADGKVLPVTRLPLRLKDLKDDPYRSLAGFVREAGGFNKVQTPFAEFLWADFYRTRIKEKTIRNELSKTLEHALKLASHKDAAALPGFLKKSRQR